MLTSRALNLSNPGSVSSRVSIPWWLCLTRTHLYRARMLAGQADHARECDGSATGTVQTKIRSKATTRAFISQGELRLQRKKWQELVWAVPCHASSLFLSTQPTAGPRGLMAKAAPATCGYHVCCSVAVSMHMQERLWPLPFLPKFGLYLGLWHLQLHSKHRLPDQLASSLQRSEPCGIGKLFHKGSGELPLGTAIPLEKWFSGNLNISLPFAFSDILSFPLTANYLLDT